MYVVTKEPSLAIPNTGFTSRWFASDSPIRFEVQRRDAAVLTRTNATGYLQVGFDTSKPYLELSEGEDIALLIAGGAYVFAKVTAKLSASSYVLDLPYSAIAYDTVVAFTQDIGYYMEARLRVNGVLQADPIPLYPDAVGRASLDVSGYLYAYSTDEKAGTYAPGVSAEPNQCGTFKVQLADRFVGNTQPDFTELAATYYFVRGAQSEEHGSNLYDYVPNVEAPAKFLNLYATPKVTLGAPFDISFIYSELLAGKSLQVRATLYNSENTQLGDPIIYDVDQSNVGKLCSFALDTVNIDRTAKRIKVELLTDDSLPPVVVDTWYIVSSPFTPSEPLKFYKSGSSVEVSGSMPLNKRGATVPLPDAALVPAADVAVTVSYNTSFFQNMYAYPPRSSWELGITPAEFALFTEPTRLYVAVFMNKTYAVGFADADPLVHNTKEAFMDRLRAAFNSAVAAINLSVGLTYLYMVGTYSGTETKQKIAITPTYAAGGFVSVALWYQGGFSFDVYPGPQTTYEPQTDSGIVLYNYTEPLTYATIASGASSIKLASYNNLGCSIRVLLPTTTYGV